MLHVPNKVYFYGELGCLSYSILGHIEEKQPKIVVSTQPDYYAMMKMKCNKISKADELNVYRANCKGSGLGLSIDSPIIDVLKSQGFIELSEFLKFKKEKCLDYIKPIKSPLKADVGLPENQKYVSISCRKRNHEPERNLSINDWKEIINMIKNHTNLPIIAHGMDIDTYDMSHLGIHRVNSINQSIAYLNKSKVFIASMSGIAQMASNCGCGIIQISDRSQLDRHINYDPFNKGAVAVDKQSFKETLLFFLSN